MIRFAACLTYVLLVFPLPTIVQSNVVREQKFAWGENIGWTNWREAKETGDGVVVNATFLARSMWAENGGWLNVGNGPTDAEAYANVDDVRP